MNRLGTNIQKEIRRRGPITFARFMELALYAPGLGYYEPPREIGKRGDFFTSVSVGPLFGELLACQFARWFDAGHSSDSLQIVEAGAHHGTLAGDILDWMDACRPDLFVRLEYCLVEPSAARRALQEEALLRWRPKIKWASNLAALAAGPAHRIIFCNELLDAMPVHRFAWNAANKRWDECCVGFEGEGFVWVRGAPGPELAAELPAVGADLAAVLPPGYIVECSPAAVGWWKQAASALGRGKLLAVDYGFTVEETLRPERMDGTLRTYSRHRIGKELLANPGESDITAHVHFPAIEAAGRHAGLATDGLLRQEQFLARILSQIEAAPGSFGEWTPARTRQFQTLTHPDHLGRAFHVLIQSRER